MSGRRHVSEIDSVRRLVDRVARAYAVKTAVEGSLDGSVEGAGTHGVLLAMRGVPVTVMVNRPNAAAAVQAAYAERGCEPPDVRFVEGLEDLSQMPRHDLVISFDATSGVVDWRGYLRLLAGHAEKVLVVVVRNPERIGAPRDRGEGRETRSLGGVLWELGRVREHEYLVVPRVLAALAGLRWDSVSSAALRGPLGAMVRRSAPLHAFVVDTAPRTRQARRRLRTAEEGPRKETA